MNLGAGELIPVVLVAPVVFGPGKLPELGRGLREFRRSARELNLEGLAGGRRF